MKQKAFVSVVVIALVAGVELANAQSDRWAVPPRYAISNAAVTVTTSPTLVCPSNDNRVNCTCTNLGPDAVRYGDLGITVSKGARIPADTPAEIRVRGNVYMIAESVDSTVVCTEETY